MLRFLIKDSKAGRSLAKKLSNTREGEIVPCSQEELDAYKDDFHIITDEAGGNKLVEIDMEKTYVLFADPSEVNLGDVNDISGWMNEYHRGSISIVRTTK